ncbi:hypothetical protein [Nitrososphaera viennensis]|uniref:Uncharacterized protein n=2 Tax=Nitrososphaera viennensis TaxID=1034015 RepID=A0A060HDJ7_9ARCH|nr:hypothetical protein [Nitrososphaera viennensis]AIC14789.1 hypothetical protein NVIE_005870 [Nitrososphaera viennensis EN76]UVS69744.1 hypothetical protein NWT39_02905 [Nitrososphaera viennensis]
MSYEPDDGGGGMFAKTSGKRLAILFGLVFFGAFMLIQVVQGFPLRDILIRETITEERTIAIKQGNLCVIDTPDHPRNIDNCPYKVGDRVIITYTKNNAAIESHRLAS